jgi:fructuronate reductase
MALSPASRPGPLVRLSDQTLAQASPGVIRPGYDRAATRVGVVHFGPGAFHRAHQAYYFDRMLARDPGLAISAVSLNSDTVRQALEPQDGLYSLTEREAEPTIRVIGAIREVLTAPRTPDAVFARLCDPEVRLVTATVTEKGYSLTPGGDLDDAHPAIRADLDGANPPKTLMGWLVEGLARRRAAGHGGLAVISCDNLPANGERFARAVGQFAEARGDAGLTRWIAGEVRFPSTMVDSITPATDEALRAEAAGWLGLADAWPIQRERFVQWVVAGDLGAEAQAFAGAGVILTGDVAAFERAKLRLLNGAHSTLAYVGLRLGYQSVSDAMGDAGLAGFVERLMRQDMAASLDPIPGFDVAAYIDQILARFRNPAIVHKLAQIAWDGSQKLPIRLLAALSEALSAGRPIDRLAVGVAGWMQFVRRQAVAGGEIVDPLAAQLTRIGRACTGEAADDVAAFLGLRAVFPVDLAADPRVRASLQAAYGQLGGGHPDLVLRL